MNKVFFIKYLLTIVELPFRYKLRFHFHVNGTDTVAIPNIFSCDVILVIFFIHQIRIDK